jgi:hypothetical protein
VHSDSEYSNRAKNTIQGQFSVPKDKLSKRPPHVLWRDTSVSLMCTLGALGVRSVTTLPRTASPEEVGSATREAAGLSVCSG